MAHASSARRRTARGLAIVAVATATVTGALALPASAVASPTYDTKSQCLTAQRAYSGSFTRISRACYEFIPDLGGVWNVNNPKWRFEYVTRTH